MKPYYNSSNGNSLVKDPPLFPTTNNTCAVCGLNQTMDIYVSRQINTNRSQPGYGLHWSRVISICSEECVSLYILRYLL
jgi:hypothetical protein